MRKGDRNNEGEERRTEMGEKQGEGKEKRSHNLRSTVSFGKIPQILDHGALGQAPHPLKACPQRENKVDYDDWE